VSQPLSGFLPKEYARPTVTPQSARHPTRKVHVPDDLFEIEALSALTQFETLVLPLARIGSAR
jgi:hypothetical protein